MNFFFLVCLSENRGYVVTLRKSDAEYFLVCLSANQGCVVPLSKPDAEYFESASLSVSVTDGHFHTSRLAEVNVCRFKMHLCGKQFCNDKTKFAVTKLPLFAAAVIRSVI